MERATKEGGYHWPYDDHIKVQRGVVLHTLRNIGASIVRGRFDLIGYSLPVSVFEPRSYLERIADAWWSAPIFLTRATQTKDPVERFKHVITFVMSGFCNTCSQTGKPFNPILGETFQACLHDGTAIFVEQSSHHPPITNWDVHGPKEAPYRFYGYGEWSANYGANSITGHQDGPHFIQFPDGGMITFHMPKAIVSGMAFGERILQYIGDILFEDKQHHLRCELSIGYITSKVNDKAGWFRTTKVKYPSDYFRGEIVRTQGEVKQKKKKKKKKHENGPAQDGIAPEDDHKKIDEETAEKEIKEKALKKREKAEKKREKKEQEKKNSRFQYADL